MFERFTERARRVIILAREEAGRFRHDFVGTEHVLLGLIRDGEGIATAVLQRLGLRLETVKAEVERALAGFPKTLTFGEVPFTPQAKRVLELSIEEARQLGHNYIGTEHLLLGLMKEGQSIAAKILESLGARLDEVRQETLSLLGDQYYPRPKKRSQTPVLDEFARDLTQLARENKLDPVIGREQEIERVIQILARRTKNNPVLIGEPGVGKTAIVEGLATRIVEGAVPMFLAQKKMLALDLSLIVAGTKYRGQFEERLKGIIRELRENADLIIFIDEIHSLIGAGSAEGSLDAANILKPALSRGEVTCIGATTLKEYRKYIEKDRSLLRRFQAVQVTAPSENETFEILEGVKDRYEQFHKVRYLPEAIRTAVYQSNRYITDRFFPDKAIDLLDEAGAKVKLKRVADTQNLRKLEVETRQIVKEMKKAISDKDFEKAVFLREREIELKEEIERTKTQTAEKSETTQEVTRRDIEEIISSWTGIPVASLEMEEAEKLLHMEDALRRRIVGQEAAIASVSKAIRRSRLGVNNPNRPMGSFMFLGPSGVGKTEVARRLAEFLFENPKALVRFDMSEYMEKHAVSKLIGSPPGYVGHEDGGQLTERIRRRPYSVILFDGSEKAHPDIANLLLQILEDGILTDAYGNVVDFKNTLIIMTSNIGTKHLVNRTRVGFGGSKEVLDARELEDLVLKELKKDFSPEFINRIDEIIVFHPLGRSELAKICRLLIGDVNRTLAPRGASLDVDEAAIEWLLSQSGDDPNMGARPLRRAIQKHVEDAVSELLIAARDEKVEAIEVRAGPEGLLVTARETESVGQSR